MTSKEAVLELICEAKSANIDEGRVCFLRKTIEKDLTRLEKLEDIEEELGIDLITLFKALKNGIYLKGRGNFKGHILYCNCPMLSFVHKTIETQLIEDYGKMWALTREELEENDR